MKLSDLKNTRWTLDHPELGTGPVSIDSYSLRDLWREDGNTTLGAQKAIDSGVFKKMYLQDQEIMIRHAEKILNDAVNS